MFVARIERGFLSAYWLSTTRRASSCLLWLQWRAGVVQLACSHKNLIGLTESKQKHTRKQAGK